MILLNNILILIFILMILIPIIFFNKNFNNDIESFKNKNKNKNKKIVYTKYILNKTNNKKYTIRYDNNTISISLNNNTIDNISMFFDSNPDKAIANKMIFKFINHTHYQFNNSKNYYNIFINHENNSIKIIENEYDKIFKIKIKDNSFKINLNKKNIGNATNYNKNITLSINNEDKLIQFPIFIALIIYLEIENNDKKDLDDFFTKVKTHN